MELRHIPLCVPSSPLLMRFVRVNRYSTRRRGNVDVNYLKYGELRHDDFYWQYK